MSEGASPDRTSVVYRQWAHAPSHLFAPNGAYFVTAGTYRKEFFFDTPRNRTLLLTTIFDEADEREWSLQAWAVFANHYHFVALAPEGADSLSAMIRAIHSRTALFVNAEDRTPGRRIWYQYRDTCLSYRRSYLARLNYVHHNPERHGVVKKAEDYQWCSMRWFKAEGDPAFQRTVLGFRHDRVSVMDDFRVV